MAEALREACRDLYQEAIRRRAYARWEAAGRPAGRDLEFWLDAEAEFCNRHPGIAGWGRNG
jgi:hypothetical protein